ncbi:NAD(P)-binding domain-containing protein, partial [Streptomyces sp. NPDC017405]|uniref:NAD(P)-binding domain-containing protein n=1 Tax=Streptomyces sp. NPDC017405 TaxID=3364993 RepID=UPI0037AA4FD2
MSTTTDLPAVTVLGLGPMGRSLAGAFLGAGLRTTVWNRTPGRDRELTERGAHGAGGGARGGAPPGVYGGGVVGNHARGPIRGPEGDAPARAG